MEPVSSVMGTIIKLLQEIAKAERSARRNRTRCRELARRAEAVGNVLRASKAGARADAAPTRMSILSRLKEALDDALKLVESSSRSGGLVSRLLTSGARAARFDDVDKRITTCLVDLAAANGVSIESKIDQLAARDRHPRTNKPQKQVNAGNAPPKGGSRNDKNGGQGKGGQNGGKGSKRRRGKKAARAHRQSPTPAFYPNSHGYAFAVHHQSIEEDPTSCPVM
ncbi:uncharacterized protein LOC112902661 isoform X2 [Panicum hallii]|uniref:uncharacterized protein LOC112902661 isoform X2 n=1 Tax=Panicum hallii TaxID=206008 RepID=UPI000DF4D288|nr:uncharacterized protein LOC112902661 isoform X2 [Panicum hallii]